MSASDSNLDGIKPMLTKMAAETADWQAAAGGSIADAVAGWLAPQYLLALRGQLAVLPEGPEHFKLLRQAAGDVVALQRGGHSAGRLQLDREKFGFEQQKYKDGLAAAQTALQKLRDPKLPLRKADRQAIVDRLDEFFGLK